MGSLRVPEMCGRVNQWNPLLCHQDKSLKVCSQNIAKLHVLVSVKHNLTSIKTQEILGDLCLGLNQKLIPCLQVVHTSHNFGID
jgi:hypothetical protein